MVPTIILDAIESFDQKELQVMGETLKVVFGNKYEKYPFTDKCKLFGDKWERTDFLHYFNTINFDTEHSVCMQILAVISTILSYRVV